MSLTDEDQKLREGRMTATRIVKVAGLSPYGNAHDVFREMVEGYQWKGNGATARGNRLEGVICDWYQERTGLALQRGVTTVHPKRARICATPDRMAAQLASPGEFDRVVEAKSLDFQRLDECGEEGTDQIPQDWVAQTQIQMDCLGLRQADVPVMFGVAELRIYRVTFDPELAGMLADIGEKFLRDHVDTKRPPPVDASESCTEALKARFAQERKPPIKADDYLETLVRDYLHLRKQREQDEAHETEARNRLMARIGDAEGVIGRDWKISWRRNKDSLKTDWESLAKAYTPTPAELAKHTTTKPGPRVFRVSGPKEK